MASRGRRSPDIKGNVFEFDCRYYLYIEQWRHGCIHFGRYAFPPQMLPSYCMAEVCCGRLGTLIRQKNRVAVNVNTVVTNKKLHWVNSGIYLRQYAQPAFVFTAVVTSSAATFSYKLVSAGCSSVHLPPM
jgi:hypothetical protein